MRNFFFYIIIFLFASVLSPVYGQFTLRVGIGYFKDVEKKAFYAPVVVLNKQFTSVAIAEGEPIIELNGKSMKVYTNLVEDEAAFLSAREEWYQALTGCEDCTFRTLDPSSGGKKSWVGYKGIFGFNQEFKRVFTRAEPDLNSGFLGFTYKIQKKENTVFTYVPIVQEVVKGSPAEVAGIRVGEELSGFETEKGEKETIYNVPLEWVIMKLKGDISTFTTLFLNTNRKVMLQRANLYGEVSNPQVIKNCISGNCSDGKGVMKIGDETYNGYFVAGKYEGKGKILKEERIVFDGNFKKGKKNGSGIEYRPNGVQVESIFTNGRAGSSNKYILPNGFAYYEIWKGEIKAYYDINMNSITETQFLAGVNQGSFRPTQASEVLYADNMTPKSTAVPTTATLRGESPKATPIPAPKKTTEIPPISKPPVVATNKPTTSPAALPVKTTPPTPKTSVLDNHKPAAPPVVNPPATSATATGDACKHCKGSGMYASYEKCKAGCKSGYVNCTHCKGTLSMVNAKTGEKEFCTKGRKINAEILHGHECTTCKGMGLVKGEASACIFCKGSGKNLKK